MKANKILKKLDKKYQTNWIRKSMCKGSTFSLLNLLKSSTSSEKIA